LEGGPPSFPQTHRGSWYSGIQRRGYGLSLRDSHPLWCRFPTASSRLLTAYCWTLQPPLGQSLGGLGCSRFARHYCGNLMLMSSRRATEMFQLARGPPPGLCIHPRVSRHDSGWVAPFGFSGLIARMQLPLNVSPVSASFIGLQRRGIHLVLSLACWLVGVCVCVEERWRGALRACRPAGVVPGRSSRSWGLVLSHSLTRGSRLAFFLLPSAKLK
jgi:hypothetical protein